MAARYVATDGAVRSRRRLEALSGEDFPRETFAVVNVVVGAVWRWEDIVSSNWRRLGEVDHLGIAVILRRGEGRGGEGRGGRGGEWRGGEGRKRERKEGVRWVSGWTGWLRVKGEVRKENDT